MINRKLQVQFLLVLLIGAGLLSFFILNPFFAPLALAAIFAVVLHPLYTKIHRQLGNRRALAALATVFISLVCIITPLTLLGTQVFHEAVEVYGSVTNNASDENIVNSTLTSLGIFFENKVPGTGQFFTDLSNNVDTYTKQGLVWLINHVGVALSSVSALLLALFIFLISFYYLLLDGPKLKQTIMKLSPLDDKDDSIVFNRLNSAVNSVVKGSLTIAIVQSILTAIGFTLFGIPNAALWGTVAFVAALIPGFGTALVILPAVLYLFFTGNPLPGMGLLAWGVVAVGFIDNLLYPKLVGHELKVHPLLVLLSVLGGVAFFGPLGIFLGPITISLLLALISIYSYFVSDEIVEGVHA